MKGKIERAAGPVIAAMRASGFADQAIEVSALAKAAEEGSEDAAKRLHTAHIEWLGDLTVKDPNWTKLLDELSQSTSGTLGLPPDRWSQHTMTAKNDYRSAFVALRQTLQEHDPMGLAERFGGDRFDEAYGYAATTMLELFGLKPTADQVTSWLTEQASKEQLSLAEGAIQKVAHDIERRTEVSLSINLDKAERLMFFHTFCLWGFIGSILLAVAAATELKGTLSDILVPTGLMLMLTAWLAFNVGVVMLGAYIRKTWVGWLAVSVLLGPVGMLIAYFSARSAAQDAITAIKYPEYARTRT